MKVTPGLMLSTASSRNRMQGAIRLMARKLKTYQTSLGFFEQAIAAPSMKAALEAWGADSNLFHQGAAKESHDPDIIAATMAKPGTVSDVPWDLTGPSGNTPNCRRPSGGRSPHTSQAKANKSSAQPDKATDRKAAQAYERERRRREREEAKEEAVQEKERERRQKAIVKAQASLSEAMREHD